MTASALKSKSDFNLRRSQSATGKPTERLYFGPGEREGISWEESFDFLLGVRPFSPGLGFITEPSRWQPCHVMVNLCNF